MKSGFTLIEMSIVLVIIGLIVGGVLVGQDLIKAAQVRATISQVEKFNTAMHTFQNKYGYLPGDIPDPQASSFGFKARGTTPGLGDGNGIIEGSFGGATGCGYCVQSGESVMVWVDLSTAGLIDGSFNTATVASSITPTQTDPTLYFPPAKIGNSNYFYVFSGGYSGGHSGATASNSDTAYWGLSATNTITKLGWAFYSSPGLTVAQAYNIDSKIDDGLPQSGKVQAYYYNYTTNNQAPSWAAGGGLSGAHNGGGTQTPTTNATPYLSTNCYDNGGNVGTQLYSVTQNATQVNCALSFQFQ